MTLRVTTEPTDVALYDACTTAEVSAESLQSPSTEARYARARRLACEIKQLLADVPSAHGDYRARLACSLAGDLADVLDELAQSPTAVDGSAR